MAYEMRFRPVLAACLAFLVGCAVFVHSTIERSLEYVGHSLFSIDWQPDPATRLHIDSMERELRASTLKLTALGERFKAFIERRREHAYFSDGGFIPDIGHPAV